jgi:hypothetical protein
VNADDDLYVYGLMRTLGTYGAVPIHKVKTGSDGTTTDVGDLAVEEGHKLAGRIVLNDGKPLPPHTRVLVSREHAWDSQIIELDQDGRFEATGLSTEEMTLSSVIRGYQLSPKNACASPLNPGLLQGLVDRDLTGLTILYEKGNRPSTPPAFNDPGFRKKNSEFEARRRKKKWGQVHAITRPQRRQCMGRSPAWTGLRPSGIGHPENSLGGTAREAVVPRESRRAPDRRRG